MTARPARHRTDASADASTFWAARDLLAEAGPGGRPRHARKVTSKYATHVGRVGALAVSLGIGFAVVNSATPAYAETDADSGTSTTTSSSSPSETTSESVSRDRSTSSKPSVRTGTRAERAEARSQGTVGTSDIDDADDVEIDDSESLTSPTVDDTAELTTSGKSPDPVTDVPDVDPSPANDQSDDTTPALDGDTDESPAADGDTTTTTTAATTTVTTTLSGRAAARAAVSKTVQPETQTQELTEVNVMGAVMSTALGGILDTDAPVSNPINDAIFAYVRRLINHTFFNKAPIVRDVTTEQILGTVVIDIDAYDPNGDPLTYDIVQPAGGVVVQIPFTSKFIYTPTTLISGDPKPVEFQIIIRDDSEHLTGALGAIQNLLHSVARAFGLAEADNVTHTVAFEIEPLVELPPGLIAVGNLAPYQLGSDPIALLTTAKIEDLDSDTLKRAELKFTAGYVAGDTLHFADTEDIKGSWDPATKTLTLSGPASLAAYEAALKSVTFSATSVGALGRVVSIDLIDHQDNNLLLPLPIAVTVIPPVFKAPGLAALPGLPYRIGDAPGRLLSFAEIIDLDSDNLSRVVLEIIGGLRDGDVLGYVKPEGSNINPVWDAGTGTLTLEGVASKAAYEAALKAVTFEATELGPLSRTIAITLIDEDGIEGLLDTPVLLGVFAAPELPLTIVPQGLPAYTLGKPAVRLLSSVKIHNADDDTLTGATVTIALAKMSGDKLVFTGAQVGNIQVTQTNEYTLTLAGVGSVAQYEQAFKQIAFSATQMGLPRTVTFTAVEADGDGTLVPAPVVVTTLLPVPPTVVAPSLGVPAYTIGKRGVVLAPTVLIGDLDSTHLTKATLEITAFKQSGDKLSYTPIAGNPITASWDGTTLTLQGTATLDQYRAALESVTFEATGGALLTRFVQIHVWDDSGERSLVPASGEVIVKNPDRPLLAVTGPSLLSFPKARQDVRAITSATIIDTDSSVLYGASVKIDDGFVTGDTLRFDGIAGNPITGTYNSATRELTLTGTATKAQYAAALEAVVFRANEHGAGWLLSRTRTLTVTVTDDSNLKPLLPGSVLVTIYK